MTNDPVERGNFVRLFGLKGRRGRGAREALELVTHHLCDLGSLIDFVFWWLGVLEQSARLLCSTSVYMKRAQGGHLIFLPFLLILHFSHSASLRSGHRFSSKILFNTTQPLFTTTTTTTTTPMPTLLSRPIVPLAYR